MLLELRVHNFAIIENVQVQFQQGLNILSGETGAGKSVLLKSLALLMGGKAPSKSVRPGQKMATIEGSFDLSDRKDLQKRLTSMGIEVDDSTLIVRRQLSANGRSRVYLNDSMVPLNQLQNIISPLIALTGSTAPLIEMTSQNESRHLLSRNYHLELLDSYAGLRTKSHQAQKKYNEWKETQKKIQALNEKSQMAAQRLDFLHFQREEIQALDLQSGEETSLEEDVKRLKNTTKLSHFCQESLHLLESDRGQPSVLSMLQKMEAQALELLSSDTQLKNFSNSLSSAKTMIEDSLYELRQYHQSLEQDPQRLNQLEDRLSRLRKIQRKYGMSVDEIFVALEEIENEIDQLENHQDHLDQLEKNSQELYEELLQQAHDLHQRRLQASEIFQESVNSELCQLNMKGVTFEVSVTRLETLQAHGVSQVEFLIRSSKKGESLPLAKFASGGELSRILLSLKCTVGQSDLPRTYLFDEVDAGVSGHTAEKVGRKLKEISQGQQVICITHLSQVACFADSHFLIHKESKKSDVEMSVIALDKTKQVREIARMISGEEITRASLAHAKELLQKVL